MEEAVCDLKYNLNPCAFCHASLFDALCGQAEQKCEPAEGATVLFHLFFVVDTGDVTSDSFDTSGLKPIRFENVLY